MIRQSGSGFGGSDCGPDVPSAARRVERLSGGRLGDGRNRRDRLQDLGSDLVGVALRVRTAVFEIALVAVIGEAVGYADRGAAVRNAVAELGDRSGLVLAGQPLHQIAGHPHFVSSLLGALAEDLEFPLSLRDFGVDAFVVDAGREAQIEMLLDDLASDSTDVRVTDAGIVRALWRGIAGGGKAERTAVLVKEIFLLKPEPCP